MRELILIEVLLVAKKRNHPKPKRLNSESENLNLSFGAPPKKAEANRRTMSDVSHVSE